LTKADVRELARRLGPDQPFYGLQSRGLYGGARPLLSVEEIRTSAVQQQHGEREREQKQRALNHK